LAIHINGNNLVATKTILLCKCLKRIAIKAAGTVVPGREPEITLAVFGDVLDVYAGQAIGYGIGPPDAFAVK